MTRRYRPWRETEVEHFRNHPEEIPLYLDIALEEAEKSGSWGAFMGSLRVAVEARGELSDRAHLDKASTEDGVPRVEAVGGILRELGLRLSVRPVEHASADQQGEPIDSGACLGYPLGERRKWPLM